MLLIADADFGLWLMLTYPGDIFCWWIRKVGTRAGLMTEGKTLISPPLAHTTLATSPLNCIKRRYSPNPPETQRVSRAGFSSTKPGSSLGIISDTRVASEIVSIVDVIRMDEISRPGVNVHPTPPFTVSPSYADPRATVHKAQNGSN